MADYVTKYKELSAIFNQDIKELTIPGSDIKIVNTQFVADYTSEDFFNKSDFAIKENSSFSYPVFIPGNRDSKNVILLLHGLNERKWEKYLVWGYTLSENTGSYVIMFPISFHINRSPASWSNPRIMLNFLTEWRKKHGEAIMSSVANIAISARLIEEPRRFMNSGYLTACDIINLITSIRTGEHPVIPKTNHINIFGFSIGAYLAEILIMANTDNLFSDSKLFMFCGGSVFSAMNGTSRYIMDSMATERISRYYLNDFENEIKQKNPLMERIISEKIGETFRSMIDFERFKNFREKTIDKIKDRIMAVGLLKDTIIPPEGIIKTLNTDSGRKNVNVEVMDFPFPYSHENPFPPIENIQYKQIDDFFKRLMESASNFLA
ncbi:MAG: hypothetical protein KBG40_07280 [Bacteroidales bacterium]|nr:hypothetical protein [Bacteroidales bacterium]